MEGPSPLFENLLFEDVPPRITFTNQFNGEPEHQSFTPEDVRTQKLRVHPMAESGEDCETHLQACDYVALFLDEENHSLYRQWCYRHGISLGSQLTGK